MWWHIQGWVNKFETLNETQFFGRELIFSFQLTQFPLSSIHFVERFSNFVSPWSYWDCRNRLLFPTSNSFKLERVTVDKSREHSWWESETTLNFFAKFLLDCSWTTPKSLRNYHTIALVGNCEQTWHRSAKSLLYLSIIYLVWVMVFSTKKKFLY